MGLFSLFSSRGPSVDAKLQRRLDGAEFFAAREFAQCSPTEQRGMLQMRRMELFRQAARDRMQNDAHRQALYMTAHAWWIMGLVLQRERKSEVAAAVSRAAWDATNVGALDVGDVLQWAASTPAFATEQQAEQFAAELWRRLGLPEAARPRAMR